MAVRTSRLRTLAALSGTAALVLGALLTGCAGSPGADDTSPGAGSDGGAVTQPPLGGQWVLVAGADAEGMFELPETPNLTLLSLDLTGEGTASGSGGCNSFSGTVTDEPGEGATAALQFGPLLSTKRACADDAANSLESRYLQALGNADTYAVTDARLTITGPDGVELDFDQAPSEDD